MPQAAVLPCPHQWGTKVVSALIVWPPGDKAEAVMKTGRSDGRPPKETVNDTRHPRQWRQGLGRCCLWESLR